MLKDRLEQELLDPKVGQFRNYLKIQFQKNLKIFVQNYIIVN